MSDHDTLDQRLRAVERALTDDSDLTDLRDAAELTREIERLAGRLDDAEERLADLDAATQALRGYVGNVRAVNESVERRADAALAKAESVEAALDDAGTSESGPSESGWNEPERGDSDRRGIDRRDSDRSEVERPDSGPRAVADARCPECNRQRPPDPSESDDGDSGLLARIAEALP